MNKNITDYNIRTNFNSFGIFQTNLQKYNNKIPGRLLLSNGKLYLILFGDSSSYFNDMNKSSNDFTIYGQLSNGKHFSAFTFNQLYYTKSALNPPDYFLKKYIIYNSKFYIQNNKFDLFNDSTYFNCNIDLLKNWALINPNHRKSLLKSDKNLLISKFKYKKQLFSLYLNVEEKQFDGQFKNENIYNNHFTVKSNLNLNFNIIKDISHELLQLMMLLMYRKLAITNVIWDYNNTQNNYLKSTNVKEKLKYSNYNEPLSLLNISKVNVNDKKIFKRFMEKDAKFNSLINSILVDITSNNPSFSSLVNYTNAIEFYYSDATYSNGKLIKDFASKIKKFINNIPYEMKNMVFLNKNNESYFINEIKNTRDYFVHGINKNSVAHGLKLSVLVRRLHSLIYYFILHKLGLNDQLIINHIKMHINGNKESDYLNM